MPSSLEEQNYAYTRRYSTVGKKYCLEKTITSVAVWSELLSCTQQQFPTLNALTNISKSRRVWFQGKHSVQSGRILFYKHQSDTNSQGLGVCRCLTKLSQLLIVSSGLRKTLVSCLLFSAAFSIQSASAQNSNSPALKNAIVLNLRKKLEFNPAFHQKQKEMFQSQTLTDGEDFDRVASFYEWILTEVEDGTDIVPEFFPIQERRIESGVGENTKQKTNVSLTAVQTINPSKLSTLEEKISAKRNLLIKSLKTNKSYENVSEGWTQDVNPVEDTTPEFGYAGNLGVVESASQQQIGSQLAQQNSGTPEPENQEIDDILKQLDALPQESLPFPSVSNASRLSPAFTISNPNGYGADNFTAFISASYQRRTRFTRTSDGELGLGIGLGNAVKAVGVELAYTFNTFGSTGEFGSGAFSIKVHRRIAEDMSVAVGWNQFAKVLIGDSPSFTNDFPENSYYAVFTKVFNTQKYIDAPFSRVAVTAGVGSGQFLNFDQITEAVINDEAPTGLGIFGSIGIRILRPISFIMEWSGQDLGIGLSIVPFKNIPVVITPAIRDISGAGDGARFIMGTGISIQL